MKTKPFTLIALFLLVVSSISATETCVKTVPGIDPKFCSRPPSAPVKLGSYTGRWFLTHISGSASRFSRVEACTTANYTLQADGSIRVLNCEFVNGTAPTCATARATRQEGGKSGELQVQFFPSLPPQPYIVAAIIGHPSYEYAAAAVYSCEPVRGELQDGFFILMRNPYRSRATLRALKQQLKCRGYDIGRQDLLPTRNGKGCKYFFGPDGFTIGSEFTL